ENIRDYNQSIMEFGAIQCAPKKPYCLLCPLNESCMALKENRVDALPIKQNKTKVRNRHFNYLVFLDRENNTLMEQRQGKGIWQNLYQFPLVESQQEFREQDLMQKIEDKNGLPIVKDLSLYNNEPIVHKLSHQHLHTKFWIAKTAETLENGIHWSDTFTFPVPVLIADFIKTFKI